MKNYPNGIIDLITADKPKENEPQIILLFNAPLWFCKRYGVRQPKDNKKALLNLNVLKEIGDLFKFSLIKDKKNILFEEENEQSTGLLELNDMKTVKEEKLEDEVNRKIELTDKVREILLNIFENFDSLTEELINSLLEKYEMDKRDKLSKDNPDNFEKLDKIYQKMKLDEEDEYTSLDFEDLILIIARIIKYYTKLNIYMDFTFLEKKVIMSVWGTERQLDNLAERMKYQLKLKDYALKFQKVFNMKNDKEKGLESTNEIKYHHGTKGVDDDRTILIGKDWIPLKYHYIHVKNVLDFTPTKTYHKIKEEKYQRYEPNDDYHECNINFDSDEICDKGCSKYRNIDKIRIIYNYVDQLLKIKDLTEFGVLNYILIKRNNIDYSDKLTPYNLIVKPFNIYNVGNTNDFIYTIRNFFGEELAYYFLWLTNYIKWLVFPSLLGIIFEISYKIVNKSRQSHNPILSLIMCAFFILWGKAFIYQWNQKEQLYNYIWGTENYKKSQLDQESFVPDGYIPLLIGQKAPYVNKYKKYFRIFVSYIFIFFMMCIVFGFINIIFTIKALLINKYPKRTTEIGILIGFLNTIQINFMSGFYQGVAKYFNDKENHRKEIDSKNALALKLIIYDFVNSYFSIFYIGFIKRSTLFGRKPGKCNGFRGNDSCSEEIKIQLYTIVFIKFIFDFWELGRPILKQKSKIFRLKQQLSQDDIKPYSLEHQMICNDYNMVLFEYSEMIINIGYVFLFAGIAPLVPVFIFLLGYLERAFDTYKIFFLERVNLINPSNGIEIYNKIFKIFIYLGLISNAAFVFFADNYFLPEMPIYSKINIYCVFVFVIFLMSIVFFWNILPPWFQYLEDIKELYNKKYYERDNKNLPHLHIVKKKGLKMLKEKIKYQPEEKIKEK